MLKKIIIFCLFLIGGIGLADAKSKPITLPFDTEFNSESTNSIVVVAYLVKPPYRSNTITMYTPSIVFSPINEKTQEIEDNKKIKLDDGSSVKLKSFIIGHQEVKKGDSAPEQFVFFVMEVPAGKYVAESVSSTSLILGTVLFDIKPGTVNYLGHYTVDVPDKNNIRQNLVGFVLKCAIYCNPKPVKATVSLIRDNESVKKFMEQYVNIKGELQFPLVSSEQTFQDRSGGLIGKLEVDPNVKAESTPPLTETAPSEETNSDTTVSDELPQAQ